MPPQRVEQTHRGRLFSVEVLHLRDENGHEYTREVVRHPGAVLIVPVVSSDRIVMIRNHRVAVGQTLWELPAGKIEPGEDPARTAARELVEETGYRAGSIEPLGEFYTSPGFADELMRVFIARELQPGSQRLEGGEEIEVHTIDRDDALAMTVDGRLRDGKSIAGLLMWHRREQTESAARA